MNPKKVCLNSEICLYARIKRTSKYYYQGLDSQNKPVIFKVEEICNGSHPFRLNSNNYKVSDLAFFVKSSTKQLIKL